MMREPFILNNTIVTTWKALKEWPKQSYLANQPSLFRMEKIQKGPNKTFYFFDNKTALAKLGINGLQTQPDYEIITMNISEFLQKMNNKSTEGSSKLTNNKPI